MTEHSDNPNMAARFMIDQQMMDALQKSVDHGATVWFAALRMMEVGTIQMVANFGPEYTATVLRDMLANIEAGKLDYREGNFSYSPPPR